MMIPEQRRSGPSAGDGYPIIAGPTRELPGRWTKVRVVNATTAIRCLLTTAALLAGGAGCGTTGPSFEPTTPAQRETQKGELKELTTQIGAAIRGGDVAMLEGVVD